MLDRSFYKKIFLPVVVFFIPMWGLLATGLTTSYSTHTIEPDSNGWYTLSYVSGEPWAADHVGYGNDTVAVVFNPIAPCSVHAVQISWYESGTVFAFAADYSDYVDSITPGGVSSPFKRNTLDASPIGSWYTSGTLNEVKYSLFYPMDVGGKFQVGDPVKFTAPSFVIRSINTSIVTIYTYR